MEKRADAATRRGDLPGFLQTLPSRSRAEAARAGARVQEQELRQWGLTGINLRSYQLEGVNWLAQRFHCQNGCILGDEMGLGKTCQTIALFIYLAGRLNDEGPFLILCPLSVLSNWKEEIERFAPGLSCVTYTGDKEERASLQPDLKQKPCFHVLLTTYEISLKDAAFLRSGNDPGSCVLFGPPVSLHLDHSQKVNGTRCLFRFHFLDVSLQPQRKRASSL